MNRELLRDERPDLHGGYAAWFRGYHLALDLAIRYGLFHIQEDQMVLGYQINKPDADHPCLSVSSASGKYQIRYIFILAYLCVSSRI